MTVIYKTMTRDIVQFFNIRYIIFSGINFMTEPDNNFDCVEYSILLTNRFAYYFWRILDYLYRLYMIQNNLFSLFHKKPFNFQTVENYFNNKYM